MLWSLSAPCLPELRTVLGLWPHPHTQHMEYEAWLPLRQEIGFIFPARAWLLQRAHIPRMKLSPVATGIPSASLTSAHVTTAIYPAPALCQALYPHASSLSS